MAYSFINSSTKSNGSKVAPICRFWKFYDQSCFKNISIISKGNFGQIKKAKFQNFTQLQLKKQLTTYANQTVAIKDPKGTNLDFVEQQYCLSHEIHCTIIIHPNLVNYISGVELKSPQRVGIVMELMEHDLRTALMIFPQLYQRESQLNIMKQIASGMNFLHSLNPYVLHRDLRPPNILISIDFTHNVKYICKIADFGISNLGQRNNYEVLYTSLIPPECLSDSNSFTPKGDVYFYGWIIIELVLGKQPSSYELSIQQLELESLLEDVELKNIIFRCLDSNPSRRPSFKEILNSRLLTNDYDLEYLAQQDIFTINKSLFEERKITPYLQDSFHRNLIHQACIFGNNSLLKYLIGLWGTEYLHIKDKYNLSLSHFAARNGNLEILQYLNENHALTFEKESRFETTSLDLAVAMKHEKCIDLLISQATLESLNSALLSACQEGNLTLVKKLLDQGANIECQASDTGAHPLDRASYSGHLETVRFLIQRGACVNQERVTGSTPLFQAASVGHKDVVQLLLESGADPNKIRHDDNASPLFMASQKGQSEVVELLIAHKANVNQSCIDLVSPLIIACESGHLRAIEVLVQNGANINHVSEDGTSPLTIATYHGHDRVVEYLLKHGANVHYTDGNGLNALAVAKIRKFEKIQSIIQNFIENKK